MQRKLSNSIAALLFLSVLIPASTKAFAGPAKNMIPLSRQQATDLGPIDANEEMTLTVHLNMTGKEGFDKAVEELYNPQSPTYQHWLTDEQMRQYAPSPSAVSAVRSELIKNGLTIISADPLGFSIRVQGTAASVQKAFQTQIHQYALNQKTFRSATQPVRLTGGAEIFVHVVSGLEGGRVHSLAKAARNPHTGKPAPPIPLAKLLTSGQGLSSIITDDCFTGPDTFTFKTPGASLPTAVYFGNVYNADYAVKACDFTSAQLQAHYGLPAAYAKGFDGTGQTIALVEGYGYPTIEADANAFSKLNGLPALDSTNFEIVYPEGKPKNPNAGVELGWDVEIALDVQWSHSIAPKAKIIVVATNGQDNEDFQDSLKYVTAHHLANSVSNSWEEDSEQFAGPDEVESFNVVLEEAAAKGISVNFSSGDGGDDGNGSPIGAPEVPADAPYATGVGGTAILNKFYGSNIEVGWGDAQTQIQYEGPTDPPIQFGFIGGAGGGESVFFTKPKWQAALPGSGRQVPDVSALADPYTGVPIVLTSSGVQGVQVGWGGTSLACPIFSAFWALANQAAGHPLGQAAPHLAKLNSSEITDILPHTSLTNPFGIIVDSFGPTYYSPSDLISEALALGTATEFVSGIWPVEGADFIVAFGTDSSLTVTHGWDNVTGFGVPNGLPFIQAAGK